MTRASSVLRPPASIRAAHPVPRVSRLAPRASSPSSLSVFPLSFSSPCPLCLCGERRSVREARGQSLIEMLVAIAVLLIGVFAVLRLFPPGFKMLSRTGNEAQVQQLADDAAQTARNGQLQAPDGIVERLPIMNGGSITGWYVPAMPAMPGVMLPSAPPDSLTQNSPFLNALFTQRTILGERVRLKGNGASSLLLYGPLEIGSEGPNVDVQVYDPNALQEVALPLGAETNLADAAASSSGTLQRGQFPTHEFAIDYSNRTLAVSPFDPDADVERHYLLSYRTLTNNNAPLDVVDEPVDFPAEPSAGSPDVAVMAFQQGAPLPGSVQVFRAFPYGGQNPQPGFYGLLSSYAGVVQVPAYQVMYKDISANDPTITVAYKESNGYPNYAWVVAPDATLAVDYQTRDWQILRLDQDVPSDGVIHLPVTNLDILDRFSTSAEITPTTRVLAVKLTDPMQQMAVQTVTVPGTTPAPPSVNVRYGIVYMPPTWPDGTPTAGSPARIYYAAFNTWAQQPLVSYRTYHLAPLTGSPTSSTGPPGYPSPPGYRFVSIGGDPSNTANDDSSKAAFLYFTVADIGKTVNIDYSFIDMEGRNHVVLGQSARIEGSQYSNGVPMVARAAIRYNGPYAFDTAAPGAPAIDTQVVPNRPYLVIQQVQGISFQARGIFLDTGDVRRADDPLIAAQPTIWNTDQIGRLGEATEDVYVAR